MVTRQEDQAFSVLPSSDLQADIAFYIRELGMQLNRVYPSENPHSAELSGSGLSLLLDTRHAGDSGLLVVKTESSSCPDLRSPTGTEIRWVSPEEHSVQSVASHRVEICTLRGSPWVVGRAGTHTRDLIPSRLGGGIVASHIRIPNGGPVRDRVHYHTTSFQLVFCVQGWITLVYEDQGKSVTLRAGDCVTQPPHIRHRVLETSNGLEVIEIGTPAEHVTAIDNEMQLPTGRIDSHRHFHGQRFCHYEHASARWQVHRLPGFAAAETGVSEATEGMAGVRMLRASGASQPYRTTHDADVLFSFVVAGSVRINRQLLVAGDAYTLPPHDEHSVSDISADASILELSLPGHFETQVF
ncbi:MAG: cupin domain-containing protein [Granulosicoccus sp.]|nr:cupin domain-containing protein [Granulosicoccus sp.]